jgi:hypothetical protein
VAAELTTTSTPFGGVQQSGYGRALGAPGAIELMSLRTVLVG